jgi:hypothetical protein
MPCRRGDGELIAAIKERRWRDGGKWEPLIFALKPESQPGVIENQAACVAWVGSRSFAMIGGVRLSPRVSAYHGDSKSAVAKMMSKAGSSSYRFDTIFTLEARSNVVLGVITDYFNLSDQRVFDEIQSMFRQLQTLLASKGVEREGRFSKRPIACVMPEHGMP